MSKTPYIPSSDLKTILHSKRANLYYLEHCRVLLNGGRVEYVTDQGNESLYWNIPIANTTCLLLGSGTSITQGRVLTNRTKRNILRTEDEGGWLSAYSIQIVTALAALLHDLGKASKAFQLKLKPNAPFHADAFRHEWISARLFEAMIAGCQTDQAWLERLANWAEYQENWLDSLNIDEPKKVNEVDFSHLPPLAKTLIWLITSHHRLPFSPYINLYKELKEKSQRDIYLNEAEWDEFYQFQLSPTEQWVKNEKSTHPNKKQFWQFDFLATDSRS